MRIVFAAAAALAVFSPAGCDINTGTPREAKVDCHCMAAPPPAAPAADVAYVPPAHRHRAYRRSYDYAGHSGHGYAWRREYSEVSVAIYDYRSDSHSYVMGEADADGAYAGRAADGGDAQSWADGHDRHHGGAAVGDAVHHESTGSDAARMKPWHGYDADCPDTDPDRRH